MLRHNHSTLNQENLAPATAIKNRSHTSSFATPAPPTNARRTALAPKSTNAKPRAELNDNLLDDYGKAHLPPQPLKDEPIEYNIDETYPQFKPENFCRGFADIYYRNDEEDQERLTKQREEDQREYERSQRELERLMEDDLQQQQLPFNTETMDGKFRHEKLKSTGLSSITRPTAKKASSAALAFKQVHNTQKSTAKHTRLPSAATRQTASSKSKQKPAFTVARDEATAARPNTASKANTKSILSVSRDMSIEKTTAFPAIEGLKLDEENDDPSLDIGEIHVDMGVDVDNFEL